jgi:ELWxxDGT repeat protein
MKGVWIGYRGWLGILLVLCMLLLASCTSTGGGSGAADDAAGSDDDGSGGDGGDDGGSGDDGDDAAGPLCEGAILFFAATTEEHGQELWVTDCTPEGTHMVKDIYPGTSSGVGIYWWTPIAADGLFFFPAVTEAEAAEIWRSDGTEEGTFMLDAINPGAGGNGVQEMAYIGGYVYISAGNTTTGAEPYRVELNGTTPEQIEDIHPTGASYPRLFTEHNGHVFFSATDGGSSYGYELHEYDPDLDSLDVHDIRSGAPSSGTLGPFSLAAAGGLLFFVANDGSGGGTEPCYYDGGSWTCFDINPAGDNLSTIVAHEDLAWFDADDGTNGLELWSSDGGAVGDGTGIFMDINPSGDSSPGDFTVLGDVLLFSADNGTNGRELWKVEDGAAEMVKDIQPGSGGSTPVGLIVMGNWVHFLADDGDGYNWWLTDGTEEGTTNLEDELGLGSIDSCEAQVLGAIGDFLLFVIDSDGDGALELWKSDSTSGGTEMVEDIGTEVINWCEG